MLIFSKMFGLTASKYGENLMNNFMSNDVVDNELSPQELAQQFICSEFPDIESVLKGNYIFDNKSNNVIL
jgi:transcription elongation factor SPT6